MKNLSKEFEELLSLKDKYETKRCYVGSKILSMSIKELNRFLEKIHCRYSYEDDSHFKIEETKNKNDKDTVYSIKCCNCETEDQCYMKWRRSNVCNFPSDVIKLVCEMKG